MKPHTINLEIIVLAVWVRRQKRACVVGRHHTDEGCSLATGFSVSFEWVVATAIHLTIN